MSQKEPQTAAVIITQPDPGFAKITTPVIGTRSYDEVPRRKEAKLQQSKCSKYGIDLVVTTRCIVGKRGMQCH